MRTIIAGSRTATDIKDLIDAVAKCGWKITTVVSGKAKGADHLGELWANYHHIPIDEYPADWKKYGRSAGPRRNIEMSENADALIALWNGESRGTKHMIETAKKKNLKVYVHIIECVG
jgi:hypothetical protein